METWEYKAVSIDAHMNWQTGLGLKKRELADEEFQNQLNRWGGEGWELVNIIPAAWKGDITHMTVSSYDAFFKHRKPSV